MGLLQNSTRGLGTVSVNGLRRVPKPPTKIRAFKAPDCAVLLVMVLIAGLKKSRMCLQCLQLHWRSRAEHLAFSVDCRTL